MTASSAPQEAAKGGRPERLLAWGAALLSVAVLAGVIAAADRYASGDMGHLVAVEIRLAEHIRAGELWTAAQLWWALIAPQPPLGYVPGIATHTLFGFSGLVAPLTMGLVLVVCWDALRRLWGRRAWVAWLPVVSSPMIWLALEQHSRDLVAGSALLQALAWLHRSDGFRERRASVLFGVWLGVGFMCKYTFPMFAVGPCVVAGLGLVFLSIPWPGRATAPTRPSTRWKNLGFGILGYLGPAGPWYAVRGRAVAEYTLFSAGDSMAGNTASFRDPSSLESLVYYPLALRDALSLPGVALVVLALVFGLLRRTDRGRAVGLAVAAVGSVAVLSTLSQAQDRYVIPAFLALAALLPALAGPRGSGVRGWAWLAVPLVFLPQAWASLARFQPGAPVVNAAYDHPYSSRRALAWPAPDTYRPSDEDMDAWQLDEAVAMIRQVQGRDDGTIGILSGQGSQPGPAFTMVLIAASRMGYAYDFATVNMRPGPGAPPVFVGPLFNGTIPSPEFSTLYVVRQPRRSQGADEWLAAHRVRLLLTLAGPSGATSEVYAVGEPR